LGAALLHQADLALDPLEAFLVLTIVPAAVDEPDVAFLSDDVHALVHPACRIDRRMRHPHRLGRHVAVGDRIEFALELEVVVEPHALEHLDELVHAPIARFSACEELAEHLELLRARAVDDVDAEPSPADALHRVALLSTNLALSAPSM